MDRRRGSTTRARRRGRRRGAGRVLDHVDPTGAYRLTGAHSVPTVAGFDATFCAPKSVSLLFALGAPEVSNEVRNAADAAVERLAERSRAGSVPVRRGKGGHTVLDGDGFVAAAFRHRTSRAGDPHLHTHVVVANLAHARPMTGGRRSMPGRCTRGCRRSGTSTRPTCVGAHPPARGRVGPVRNGIADVAGIPGRSCGSSRPAAGRSKPISTSTASTSAKAAQLATYATRQPKTTSRRGPPAGLAGPGPTRSVSTPRRLPRCSAGPAVRPAAAGSRRPSGSSAGWRARRD